MPRTNKLVFLGLVTLLVVVAAVVTSLKHAPTSSTGKEYTFPGLTDKINEVARIEVSGKDGSLSIKRQGKDWVIEQADNYPASFSRVRHAAIAVAELKTVAEKTSNPAYYSKLGVEDPGGEKAQSKLLTLFNTTGGKLASLIIGKQRMSSAAAGSHGYYIRLPGGPRALLVEGDLNINAKAVDWFDPQIVNIKPEHISEVVIDHPDEKPLRLSRATAKDDFILGEIPEGKESQSSYTINRIEDILDGVRVEDARSADKFKFPDQVTMATVKTYDGMTAVITSAVVDKENWSRFSFDFQAPPTTVSEQASNATVETGKGAGKVAETPPATAEEKAPPTTEEADKADKAGKAAKPTGTAPKEDKDKIDQKLTDQLKQKTADWVYKIPSYKFELFTRKLDDLVKDKEPEKKDEKEEKKGS